MGLRFDEKRKCWVHDRYENGKRIRNFFRDKPQSAFQRISIVEMVSKFGQSRDSSSSTIKLDKRYTKEFFEYITQQGIGFADEIKHDHIVQFQKLLVCKGWAGSTVNRAMTVIKSLMSYTYKNRDIADNPARGLKAVAEDSKERETWTDAEFDQVYDISSDWLKDYLLGLKLTGLRPCQLSALRFIDCDLGRLTFKTSSKKGGKLRTFELPMDVDFARLIESRRTRYSHLTSFVFVNSRGRQVSSTTLYQTLKKRTDKKGLSKTSYGLRHTFGTRLTEAGAGLASVGKLMCHTKLQTTQRYIHESNESLRKTLQLVKGGGRKAR